eukprot:6180722-Pleurochrysis_carterae.AAC.1
MPPATDLFGLPRGFGAWNPLGRVVNLDGLFYECRPDVALWIPVHSNGHRHHPLFAFDVVGSRGLAPTPGAVLAR